MHGVRGTRLDPHAGRGLLNVEAPAGLHIRDDTLHPHPVGALRRGAIARQPAERHLGSLEGLRQRRPFDHEIISAIHMDAGRQEIAAAVVAGSADALDPHRGIDEGGGIRTERRLRKERAHLAGLGVEKEEPCRLRLPESLHNAADFDAEVVGGTAEEKRRVGVPWLRQRSTADDIDSPRQDHRAVEIIAGCGALPRGDPLDLDLHARLDSLEWVRGVGPEDLHLAGKIDRHPDARRRVLNRGPVYVASPPGDDAADADRRAIDRDVVRQGFQCGDAAERRPLVGPCHEGARKHHQPPEGDAPRRGLCCRSHPCQLPMLPDRPTDPSDMLYGITRPPGMPPSRNPSVGGRDRSPASHVDGSTGSGLRRTCSFLTVTK